MRESAQSQTLVEDEQEASTSQLMPSFKQSTNSLIYEDKWRISDATQLNSKMVLGQSYWGGSSQEPGTLWPHLNEIPSVCTVDLINPEIPANISMVDGEIALAKLAKEHRDAFEFLAQCKLKYSTGLFRAKHSIINIENGRISPVNYF